MTADLRRLAEQRAPNNHTASRVNYRDGKAILALLDERDRSEKLTRSLLEQLATTEQHAEAAERRVAALEEGLRPAILAAYCKVKHGNTHPTGCGSYNAEAIADEVARALLAAAPSEPRFVRGYKFRGRPS